VVFISAIILAAGESVRMGQPKLLMEWNNRTILEQTIDNYLGSAVNETIVVIGYKAHEMEIAIGERSVITVLNPHYTKGMSTSVKTGLEFVSVKARGILLALADQPLLDKKIINRLVEAFNQSDKGIIIPVHRGKRGNPVILDVKYRKDMLALTGDVGAKEIVERNIGDVLEIEVGEYAVADLDTPEDYKILRKRSNHPC
jgi:molybdenum cofactor cytidylyltransferase